MVKTLNNVLRIFICAVFTIQLTGCGTLLYPERKGQIGGRVDTGVAILDGIGLLFFVIPGVIAFAVDFNNGTIYLPKGPRLSLNEVKFDPKHTNLASLEVIIKNETGREVKLDSSMVRVAKLHSKEEMQEQFARQESMTHNDRIALL